MVPPGRNFQWTLLILIIHAAKHMWISLLLNEKGDHFQISIPTRQIKRSLIKPVDLVYQMIRIRSVVEMLLWVSIELFLQQGYVFGATFLY